MDVVKQNDGSFLCVSNGTPEENEAIDVLSRMLIYIGHTGQIAESQANAFGVGSDDGGKTCKNYAYLPYFGEIPQND